MYMQQLRIKVMIPRIVSVHGKVERVFDHFRKYRMKILLRGINAEIEREDDFHEIISDNGVIIINFATSENLIVKSAMFARRKIHKSAWTSDGKKKLNQIDDVLIGRSKKMVKLFLCFN
jgi:hypothetical protein